MSRTILLPRTAWVLAVMWAGACFAQTPSQHYDLNMYPTLANSNGVYNLNVAPTQSGPPGTITLTSNSPPPTYSLGTAVATALANSHGYVEAGISSRGGHEFSGGVEIPLVPGKADLDLAAGTGQFAMPFKVNGKTPLVNYDTYSAGLHLHPTDDIDAYIGISGINAHGGSPYGYGYP